MPPHSGVGLSIRESVFRAGVLYVLERSGIPALPLRPSGSAPPLDVALVELPDDGLEPVLAHLGKAGCPPQRVLVACTIDGAPDASDLLALGVAGCVSHEDTPHHLVQKIRAVAEGDWAQTRRLLVDRFREGEPGPNLGAGLTEREAEVLGLIASGMSNAEIAGRIHRSPGTVRNLTSSLYQKVGVRTRAEAVRWAWSRGLGRVGEPDKM